MTDHTTPEQTKTVDGLNYHYLSFDTINGKRWDFYIQENTLLPFVSVDGGELERLLPAPIGGDGFDVVCDQPPSNSVDIKA